MASSFTLRQSFDQPLPEFPGVRYIKTGQAALPTGTVTGQTDPPRYAISHDYHDWIAKGQHFLRETPQHPLLDVETVDRYESSIWHHNEADIVRSAALYLLHPIHQALTCNPRISHTIRCQGEMVSNKSRSDVTYFKTASQAGQGSPLTPFHVIEFKRKGLLIKDLFQAAIMPDMDHNDADRNERWLDRHAMSGLNTGDDHTAFKADIWLPMKQAASYALEHNTKYVAIFDWDTLALIYYPQLYQNAPTRTQRLQSGVGEYCEISIISNPKHMRMALLGFMSEAWDQKPS